VRQLGDRDEPKTAADLLRWYIERLRAWLEAAARGRLLQPGDQLELPDLRFGSGPPLAIGDATSDWTVWSEIEATHGYAEASLLGSGASRTWIVGAIRDSAGGLLIAAPEWNRFIQRHAIRAPEGVWFRCPGVPVLPPWQAPANWAELVATFSRHGVDLRELLWPLVEARLRRSRARPEQRPHRPLLVGFPFPERLGERPAKMQWIGFELPPLAEGTESRHGFRPSPRSRRLRDLGRLLEMEPLRWMRSQSWADLDLTGRGRLGAQLRDQRVLLLGAGALGSVVAELLVRGGVRSLCILDPERLEAGNLVRHALSLGELEQGKAVALATRLVSLSPHAEVLPANLAFTADLAGAPQMLQAAVDAADLVLDCTAEDSVLHALEEFGWQRERLFGCMSLGLRARRLYCFLARGTTFPRSTYVSAIDPWLDCDWQGTEEADLPREGVGCWHPLMPATAVDVWLWAAAAVKFLEGALAGVACGGSTRFATFQQHEDAGGDFAGISRLDRGEP
jgi:hypothetical protein